MEEKLVTVNIDGVDWKVPCGLNVIEACKFAGVEIPHFCYHEYLPVAGSCRLCLVSIGTPARDRATGELIKNDDGSQKIAWMPKPAIACGTKVSEGMHVVTKSELIDDCRKGVLEFLLLNHPLDCPICDKAGECRLQEYATAYGRGESRFIERKNVKPKRREIADGKIILDNERCILCSRCIRISRQLVGRDVFGFTKRGSKNEVAVYPDEPVDSNYILNVVDNCPVGALTEKAFRFKMRTWFLKMTRGISAESSAGVNTWIWSRENVIYRITPRENRQVNDVWMSDSGRYTFGKFQSAERLTTARIDCSESSAEYALTRATEILNLGSVAIVASGYQTLEELFMIRRLADDLKAQTYMVSHLRGSDDGMLVSIDKTPNLRGGFVAGILKEYPKADLAGLAAKVRDGSVKTVLCFHEDLLSLGFDAKDFKRANIIYCGSLDNTCAREAKVALPLPSEFEKSGLWINRQWRLQAFDKAVDSPAGVLNDFDVLCSFGRTASGEDFKTPTLQSVRRAMSAAIKILPENCEVPAEGAVLDASEFSGVDFPETNALHFTKNVQQ